MVSKKHHAYIFFNLKDINYMAVLKKLMINSAELSKARVKTIKNIK